MGPISILVDGDTDGKIERARESITTLLSIKSYEKDSMKPWMKIGFKPTKIMEHWIIFQPTKIIGASTDQNN
jgi:hypothetical protein